MKSISNLWKDKKTRNWIIAVIGAVILIVVVVGIFSPNGGTATAATEARVTMLDVAETIEASGSLQAQPFASLTWKTDGVIKTVNVKAGDFVKAGDVLLALEPSSTSSTIASAQADLIDAQKELDDLLNSGTDLAQAAIDLKAAQDEYDDKLSYLTYLQTNQKIPQSETLIYTQKNRGGGYEYQYKTKEFVGPASEAMLTEAEDNLALAKGELEDAQRAYDRLSAGEDSPDVAAARAKVDAAQATVNQLSIIAPFDGQVLSVDGQVGDLVSTDELSVNLADMDHLYVETQVDESDIATIKLGNQAEATLDAVPGATLNGEVTAINPVGVVDSGLVKYTVRIDLDKLEGATTLPLGTTANVVIQIKEASNTLMVPITAIQNDSEGEYVLVIQDDNSTKRVNVVGGAIVGDLVAVTGDLNEGDRVQVGQISSGPGGPGGGPFGGGN
jgi:HlyD family secretion protein